MEVTNGEVAVELPDTLAQLLVKNRGWKAKRGRAPRPVKAAPVKAAPPLDAATSDDELPDGITFAASAYTTVVNEDGEKVRVLKTDCRNGHPYAGDNVKIVVRGVHAYRECQTCLRGRNERKRARAKA